ncbi:N-6 DNA Methylase (plasmid) [Streptomyces sp. YIM 121038]|uniref:N-6 DNA methylase n=1 Tax=Streptomyces sp. YIM 121038 TaxID=2136401 RepID=UPI001162FBEB|nr:N-6 DNA methylase [Streptomyces sp. YIM 121038]QCX82205.1 N-6 DNA Methylase [Streptomyces sp. YIM 121038]
MPQSDLAARLTAALRSTQPQQPDPAPPAADHGSGNCSNPGCIKHTGVSNPPRFLISRRNGADFGESVADAWYRACGSSRMDIPAGVVAALALWPTKTRGAAGARHLSSFIAAQPPRVLVQGYAEVYASTWMRRPELMDVAAPLFRWTEEDLGSQELRGVAAVTQAALRAGVLLYTGDSDPYFRSDIDLMSWTITNLRHRSSRKGLGEYHTPPDIADLMARMLLDPGAVRASGESFNEPTAGTGGIFRSMAQTLRERDVDPHKHTWVMQELDPIAAAGAAVNTVVWDLGPRAVVVVGDSLAEGDLSRQAFAHQRAMQAHRDSIRKIAAFTAATSSANRLLRAVTSERAA